MPGTTQAGTPGRPPLETEYDVRWVSTITAPDPVEAARTALHQQRHPPGAVFIVAERRGNGAEWRVDLGEPGCSAEVLSPREPGTVTSDTNAAARREALHAALAAARQVLANSEGTEHDALNGLAETVAAFLGQDAPARPRLRADLSAKQLAAGVIETGTSRSLPAVGQAVCAAVRGARDSEAVTRLTVDGRPAAVIVPVDGAGNPACMRVDHMYALEQAGQLPACFTRTEAAIYRFSGPVDVTCIIDGDRVAAGAEDLSTAWTAAREHDYRHSSHV